jgi:uncharacterized protein (DUF433 family)
METKPAHIERKPGVCGGKPCVAGTRIRVQDIYAWHELDGKTIDQISAEFPQLTKADVYAALAYFWDHREETLKQMAESEAFAEQVKGRTPSRVQQKLAVRDATHDSLPPG